MKRMTTVAWTAIGLLAATLLGTLVYLGQRIDALAARVDAQGADLGQRIDAQGAELGQRIDAQGAELSRRVDALATRLDSRIDSLSVVLTDHLRHDAS